MAKIEDALPNEIVKDEIKGISRKVTDVRLPIFGELGTHQTQGGWGWQVPLKEQRGEVLAVCEFEKSRHSHVLMSK